MINKLLVYTILVSMTLHSTSRLGLLDQVYQKRHEIAHIIGLISEIPIAMCNGDYDFGKGLKIETHDDSDSIPQSVMHAREINLFFISGYQLPKPQRLLLNNRHTIRPADLYNLTLGVSIFHPPAI